MKFVKIISCILYVKLILTTNFNLYYIFNILSNYLDG